jgi:hypothetical protein
LHIENHETTFIGKNCYDLLQYKEKIYDSIFKKRAPYFEFKNNSKQALISDIIIPIGGHCDELGNVCLLKENIVTSGEFD